MVYSILYSLFDGTILLLLISQSRGFKGNTIDSPKIISNNTSTTRFKISIGTVLTHPLDSTLRVGIYYVRVRIREVHPDIRATITLYIFDFHLWII
jgi:hypothetical protein